jgi:hypothetical protein
MEIQRVEWETRGHIEGFYPKFERVNNIIDKKIVRMDEELDKVVGLVGEKIDVKMGEFSSDLMEALEIEENHWKDLEAKVSGLEERLEHTLTHVANLASLLLSIQSCVAEVEDAIMEESGEEDAEGEMVVSSSSSKFDPVENMVTIPIPAPSTVYTLVPVDVPEEFIPPSLHMTPSPPYIPNWEEDPSHDGVLEYWVDPEVDH